MSAAARKQSYQPNPLRIAIDALRYCYQAAYNLAWAEMVPPEGARWYMNEAADNLEAAADRLRRLRNTV